MRLRKKSVGKKGAIVRDKEKGLGRGNFSFAVSGGGQLFIDHWKLVLSTVPGGHSEEMCPHPRVLVTQLGDYWQTPPTGP